MQRRHAHCQPARPTPVGRTAHRQPCADLIHTLQSPAAFRHLWTAVCRCRQRRRRRRQQPVTARRRGQRVAAGAADETGPLCRCRKRWSAQRCPCYLCESSPCRGKWPQTSLPRPSGQISPQFGWGTGFPPVAIHFWLRGQTSSETWGAKRFRLHLTCKPETPAIR